MVVEGVKATGEPAPQVAVEREAKLLAPALVPHLDLGAIAWFMTTDLAATLQTYHAGHIIVQRQLTP